MDQLTEKTLKDNLSIMQWMADQNSLIWSNKQAELEQAIANTKSLLNEKHEAILIEGDSIEGHSFLVASRC